MTHRDRIEKVEAVRRRLKISWEAVWSGYVGRAIYERATLGLR